MLSSKEIRQGFIDFFIEQGHTFVPSARIAPEDDPTILFINAGMNQFKDVFLGTGKRDYVRAVNSQKCIRVSGKHNDLEEVGKDTYHHTFFEMLGNWSFGDYFKAQAIEWAWRLLTEVWGIDGTKLWATVFGGDAADGVSPDTDAEKLWLQHTNIARERVLRFGRKDNFWEMGETGPCGPCSEIHLDLGPDRCDQNHRPNHICQVNGGCGRFVELWNLVFIQYNRDESGKLHDLPAKHVDTGAGLERIVAYLQNKTSNYDTDLFSPIINHVADITGKAYASQLGSDQDNAFRVIADHIRTLSFSIADGVSPSNEGRGYVLRRLLRRATRFGLLLEMHEPFLYRLVPTLVEILGEDYPELSQRAEHVATVIRAEETGFARTLDRGMELFEADVEALRKKNITQIPGDKAFRLYDTYGFPLDLTELMAGERNLTVDVKGFENLMQAQRRRAQESRKGSHFEADEISQQLPQTDDSRKYQTATLTAQIKGYLCDDQYLTQGPLPPKVKIGLILDRTCAYAESGGQVGDAGTITQGDQTFTIEDVQKVGNAVVHYGTTTGDAIQVGDKVSVSVNRPRRSDTARNHTATHLLQWALQKTLGTHVHQEGSLVHSDYLRFDFTHPQAMTRGQIEQVETLVREKVAAAAPVASTVLPIDQARQLGAMALFSETYGDQVRVIAIGAETADLNDAFSREFCGGVHVPNTLEISTFKMVREESVATGVRRITALTGRALNDLLYQQSDQIEQLAGLLKTTPDQLPNRLSALLEENKKLKKQAKKGAAGDLKSAAQQLFDDAQTIGDAKIIVGQIPSASVEAIRLQIDWLRQKAGSAVIVLACPTDQGKALLFAAATDDLIQQGVKAGDIVKTIAPIVGGGGGGRSQLAQAGGKDPAKINDALAAAKEFIANTLK